MMHGCLGNRFVAAVWLMLFAPTMVFAQGSRTRATFLEGGLAVSHQAGPSGIISETYVTAPGGTTTGWTLGGGIDITPHTSIVAEWSTTGWMRAEEPSRYFTTYKEARRDRMLTAGVRFAVRLNAFVALEPMAGIAFTLEDATSQAVYTDPVAFRVPSPLVTHDLELGVGPVFGVDGAIGTGRFAVVPTLRVVRNGITQGKYDDAPTSPVVDVESIYPGGYPLWTTRIGVLARVRF